MTSRSPKNVLQREAEREADQNIAAATADSPLAIGASELDQVLKNMRAAVLSFGTDRRDKP